MSIMKIPAFPVASLIICSSVFPLFFCSSIYSSNSFLSFQSNPWYNFSFILFSLSSFFLINTGSFLNFSIAYFCYFYAFCFFSSYYFFFLLNQLTAWGSLVYITKITTEKTRPIATPIILKLELLLIIKPYKKCNQIKILNKLIYVFSPQKQKDLHISTHINSSNFTSNKKIIRQGAM